MATKSTIGLDTLIAAAFLASMAVNCGSESAWAQDRAGDRNRDAGVPRVVARQLRARSRSTAF